MFGPGRSSGAPFRQASAKDLVRVRQRHPPGIGEIEPAAAVPAAMRISVPQANPTLSLAASLGVTFPFNVLVGIPLYHAMATSLFGRIGG